MTLRVALLTGITLAAFAGNSLLCRMALAPDLIDPLAFTTIRLSSGVAVLVPLSALLSKPRRWERSASSWSSGLALFVYALGFSLAYVAVSAGAGALILFGAVQITMIGLGVAAGARPSGREWAGLAAAFAGLALPVMASGSAKAAAPGAAARLDSFRAPGLAVLPVLTVLRVGMVVSCLAAVCMPYCSP